MIQRIRYLALVFVSLILSAAESFADSQTKTIQVLVPVDIINNFQRFLAGRNVVGIDYYGGKGANRDVAEMVLVYQALFLGGFRGDVEYVIQETNYLRSLQMLGAGRAALYGTSVWKNDVTQPDSPFLLTEPLIHNGQFLAGIYTRPDNQRVLGIEKLSDLQSLTAVSSQNWHSDWRSLEAVGLKGLYHNRHWPNMVKMVRAGRADFTLAPLRGHFDQSLELGDIKLVPVSDTLFALQGSRHWVASVNNPMGRVAYDYLVKGLASLRNQGTINRAYRESGFFPAQNAQVNVINRPGDGASNKKFAAAHP